MVRDKKKHPKIPQNKVGLNSGKIYIRLGTIYVDKGDAKSREETGQGNGTMVEETRRKGF